ncbi:hypothetical protein D3C86_1493180 [compost metagenome]
MIVDIGRGDESPAKTVYMVIESGIAAKRGDDGRARLNDQPGDLAQQAINPAADGNIAACNAVVNGKRFLQFEIFRIAIHPGFRCRIAHGQQHGRGGAEAAFVCADSRLHLQTAVPLDGLGADEGNGGGKRDGKWCKA